MTATKQKPLKLEGGIMAEQPTAPIDPVVAYARAMRACQQETPAVSRDATNPTHRNRYAKLESVINVLKPIYTKNGFSLSFGTDDSPLADHIRVVCDVQHEAGYSRQYRGDFPLDTDTNSYGKTAIQATGSTYSYARRYLLLMIFNCALEGEDRDGNAPTEFISMDEIMALNVMLEDTKSDLAKFNAFMGIKSLDVMPKKDYVKAVAAIMDKKGGQA